MSPVHFQSSPKLLIIPKYECYVKGIVYCLHFNNKNKSLCIFTINAIFLWFWDQTQGLEHSKQQCLPPNLNSRPFYLILNQGWFNLCMQDLEKQTADYAH